MLHPTRTPGAPRPGTLARWKRLGFLSHLPGAPTAWRRPAPWLVAAAPLGLLAVGAALSGPSTALWPLALALGRHLTSATALPAWSVYVLGAAAAGVAWRLGRAQTGRPLRTAAPRREDYVRDRFLGVVWEWRYDEQQRPQQLCASCPDCATRLVCFVSRPPEERRIKMFCEHCRVQLLSEPGERDYLLARVARQVERKLRTGEWQDGVRQPPAPGRRTEPGLHVAA